MNPQPPPLPQRMRFVRKLLCAMLPVALLSLIVNPTAEAQNDGHGKTRAQAVLQIQAQVVPVAYRPPPKIYDSSAGEAVIYSLPSGQSAMTVIEEIRVVTARDAAAWLPNGLAQVVMLKTLTIVPQ